MQAIVYYISLPCIYLISLLPFWLLYRVSDFLFVLIYYVFGYRKKVVFTNLRNSFPEKSEKEIKKIARKFYVHFCDLILELPKALTISQKEMTKRCKFGDDTVKLFNTMVDQQKNFIVVMGHFGNWEWPAHTFNILIKHQLYVVYHPLSNKRFGDLMLKIRSRFGARWIPMQDTLRAMIRNKPTLNATAFLADQTPPPEGAYWTTFLNQDTPVFWGTEKIARKLDYPIIYATMRKVGRGYYECFGEILFENPATTKEGEISEKHTRKLEEEILKQPEIWLWSHRRWKHKRKLI